VKTIAIYITLATFVLIGSLQLYSFIMLHRDPITYERVWTDTPEVKLNGVFRAHYALTRLRSCRTDVSVFMENADTREVVMRYNYVGGARIVGAYKDILLAFQLPPPKETGCYIFNTSAANYCPEGLHVINAPTLKFCVVD
jgi:hypothetical protein